MIILSTGLRNAMLGTVGMETAFANGVLYLFTGPQPVNADAAATGTPAVIVTLASGAFVFGTSTNGINLAAPVAGVITKSSGVWSGNGLINDVAGWFRLMGNAVDSLGASTTLVRMDGSVGVGGADLNLGTTAVKVGAPLTVDVFQYTLPSN